MARRTKAEAEETRESILDAAEKLFYEQGVSRTTLEKIAAEAGVTRGAIYWHFQNKPALFNAMVERIRLPYHSMLEELDSLPELDPLMQIREMMIRSLRMIGSSEHHHRVLTIVFYRCEYLDDLNPAVCKQQEQEEVAHSIIERAFERAKQAGLLNPMLNPVLATKALHAYIGGLIAHYLQHPEEYDLSNHAAELIDVMLAGLKKPDNKTD